MGPIYSNRDIMFTLASNSTSMTSNAHAIIYYKSIIHILTYLVYLDTKYYNRGFETKQFLKERVYNNTLSKNIIFKGFLEKKIFTDKQIKKVKFCLWDEFNNDETSNF